MIKYAAFIVGVAFNILLFCCVPTISLAQTTPTNHFIFAQQSAVTSTFMATTSSYQFEAQIGNGYQGSSTLAYLTYTFTKTGTYQYGVGDLNLIGYTDNSYTTTTGQSCEWNNQYNSGANPNYPFGQGSVSSGFVQLDPINLSFNECYLDPNTFYQVVITIHGDSTGTSNTVAYGTNSPNPSWNIIYGGLGSSVAPFFPQFAITGNGFFITPEASSSGILLSGAVSFCNNVLASSTGIGATIANGLCVVTGFLFIPTPSAVQSFGNSTDFITSKAPFSWITEIRTDLSGLTASTSDNFINLSLAFGTTTQAIGITNLDVISTTTLSKYYPDPIREGMKYLIGTVFILLALSFIYRSLQNVWHKQV